MAAGPNGGPDSPAVCVSALCVTERVVSVCWGNLGERSGPAQTWRIWGKKGLAVFFIMNTNQQWKVGGKIPAEPVMACVVVSKGGWRGMEGWDTF